VQKKMRFMLIAGFAESILTFRGPLIAALQRSGYEVHVAAPELGESSPLRAPLLQHGIVPHSIPLRRTAISPFFDAWLVVHLAALQLRLRPDVTLGYTAKAVIFGSISAWIARVPNRFAMVTGLGYAFQDDQTRTGLKRVIQELYKLSLTCVKRTIFQNSDDEALFRALKIVSDEQKTAVVNGSGVDLNQFAVTPVNPGAPTCFLLIARLLKSKGVREFAAAAAIVKRRNPEVIFEMVGWIDEGPDAISEAELKQWVESGVIRYAGKLADVRSAIARCSVYVLPSYREGTPRTVLEAMAMGRAVITCDAPGCRQTVEHGRNGFLVPPRDSAALAAAMIAFLDSPALVSRMGAASREIAEEKYDVRKVSDSMLDAMKIEIGATQ
jgi:glycosyltransferase involved in cell wall biosynthesis